MEGIQDQEHQVTLQQIRRCIEEELKRAGLKVVSIYLFGSRARGQVRSAVGADGCPPLRVALAGVPADVILLSQPGSCATKTT